MAHESLRGHWGYLDPRRPVSILHHELAHTHTSVRSELSRSPEHLDRPHAIRSGKASALSDVAMDLDEDLSALVKQYDQWDLAWRMARER